MEKKRKPLWAEILFEAGFGAIAFAAITLLREGWAEVPRYALIGVFAGAMIGVVRWYLGRRADQKK